MPNFPDSHIEAERAPMAGPRVREWGVGDHSQFSPFSFTGDKWVLEQHFYYLEECIYSRWAYPLARLYPHLREKTSIGCTDSEGLSGGASSDNPAFCSDF